MYIIKLIYPIPESSKSSPEFIPDGSRLCRERTVRSSVPSDMFDRSDLFDFFVLTISYSESASTSSFACSANVIRLSNA